MNNSQGILHQKKFDLIASLTDCKILFVLVRNGEYEKVAVLKLQWPIKFIGFSLITIQNIKRTHRELIKYFIFFIIVLVSIY